MNVLEVEIQLDYTGRKESVLELNHSDILELYDFCNIIIILECLKFVLGIKIYVIPGKIICL